MDGFDESKMKQLQLLKEKMKIAKAQKVEEVKKNEDLFSLSHNVKNVRSFETEDVRFNKIGKKNFDAFTPNKKVTHVKGPIRYPFQQMKSGNANFPFKPKNVINKLENDSNMFDTPLTFEEVMRRKNEKKKRELEKNGQTMMEDDFMNNVRSFNLCDEREENNYYGLFQETNQTNQINRANNHGNGNIGNGELSNMHGGGDVHHNHNSLSNVRETNVTNSYSDTNTLLQSKVGSTAAMKNNALNGYPNENNHSINGNLVKNNTHSFNMDVVRNSQSLNMNSFKNYFSQSVNKSKDTSLNDANMSKNLPQFNNNLSDSSPSTFVSSDFIVTSKSVNWENWGADQKGGPNRNNHADVKNNVGTTLSNNYNQNSSLKSSLNSSLNNSLNNSLSNSLKNSLSNSLKNSLNSNIIGFSKGVEIFNSHSSDISRGSNNYLNNAIKWNHPNFNQTDNIQNSSHDLNISMNKSCNNFITPATDYSKEGIIRGSSAHGHLGSDNIFSTNSASNAKGEIIANRSNTATNSANILQGENNINDQACPNKTKEVNTILSTRNDTNINVDNEINVFSNLSNASNLNGSRNGPDSVEKSRLFNNTNDNKSSTNIFGKVRSNANLFNNSGSIFGKSSTTSTNVFGNTTGNSSTLFANRANGGNLFGNTTSGSNLFGNTTSGSNLFGNNTSESNLFGNTTSGSNLFGNNTSESNLFGNNTSESNLFGNNTSDSNLFGNNTSESNLFNKNKDISSSKQINNINNFFGNITEGSNIFSGSSKLLNNTKNLVNNNSQPLEDVLQRGKNDPNGNSNGGTLFISKQKSDQVSRSNFLLSENLVNTNNKLINDSCNYRGNDHATGVVNVCTNLKNKKENNIFGFPNKGENLISIVNKNDVSKNFQKFENINDINAGVMKFKSTLSNINSIVPDSQNKPIQLSRKSDKTQIDHTEEGEVVVDTCSISRKKVNEEDGNITTAIDVVKSEAENGHVVLTTDLMNQEKEKTNVQVKQNICNNENGGITRINNDSEEEKTIRKTISSYFNNFIPSIFSNPNKETAKEEYLKTNVSNDNVNKSTNIDVNTDADIVKPSDRDAYEKNRISVNTICNDKEGDTRPCCSTQSIGNAQNGNTILLFFNMSIVNPQGLSEKERGLNNCPERSKNDNKDNDNNHNNRSINDSNNTGHGESGNDVSCGMFQKNPNCNKMIDIMNEENFENKEDFEKMNQIYKNINCINKNINYINKYIPSTIENVNNFLDENINCIQNYDTLSSTNQKFLKNLKASNSSVESNKDVKSMIDVLNKRMNKDGIFENHENEILRGNEKRKFYLTLSNMGNNVEKKNNIIGGVGVGASSYVDVNTKYTNFFDGGGKHIKSGNVVNTNMLTPMEKLKLINETSKEISMDEELEMIEVIPEHVHKIMERREYFKTKNKQNKNDSKKSIVPKKIKPFVPSECSESFRNTFYTNDNNKNNIFSLKNLSNMEILNTNHRNNTAPCTNNIIDSVPKRVNNNSILPPREQLQMMKMGDSSNTHAEAEAAAEAAVPTYSVQNNLVTFFENPPIGKENGSKMHIQNDNPDLFAHKNIKGSLINTMIDYNFSHGNNKNDWSMSHSIKNLNNTMNSDNLNSMFNVGVENVIKARNDEYLSKMEEELNKHTDFISNIYTSLSKNNFICDNQDAKKSQEDDNYHRNDDTNNMNKCNTKPDNETHENKRNLSYMNNQNNNTYGNDELDSFDNYQNANDNNDSIDTQKKKRKFNSNGENTEDDITTSLENTNSNFPFKEDRCIDISNYVKEIRNSRTLADISANLTKYTQESEQILCDIINDNFKMSVKISSLSDLPFLFEEFP
ncbi:hypothetical protein, conserved [Plasmodium gonderi]|uniref:Uncharacterized protein n=1 Tax=Plasmodium gonderi TaxID=77519 RepID=A0A1Y1JNB7_PLAGO|nr:hypothetical protein, conserved [Plasmodium gonderi]GAW83750.1 hypothetical protein, conserved [Plasmodium gonderi]